MVMLSALVIGCQPFGDVALEQALQATIDAMEASSADEDKGETTVAEAEEDSTEVPVSTNAPVSTNTPEPPTATPIPQTQSGSVLHLGETWYTDGMELKLVSQTFTSHTCSHPNIFLSFSYILTNNTGVEVLPKLRGTEIDIRDNLGNYYSADAKASTAWKASGCHGIQLPTLDVKPMAVDGVQNMHFQIFGALPDDATSFEIVFLKAGPISQARWQIDVP